jgi:hypothetical protein
MNDVYTWSDGSKGLICLKYSRAKTLHCNLESQRRTYKKYLYEATWRILFIYEFREKCYMIDI